MTSILELCKVIRSKNAGPFELTFDLIFNDEKVYEQVKNRGLISRQLFSELYQIPLEKVLGVYYFDAALAVKCTIRRSKGAGDIGDTDVYGAQQHAPLLKISLPL